MQLLQKDKNKCQSTIIAVLKKKKNDHYKKHLKLLSITTFSEIIRHINLAIIVCILYSIPTENLVQTVLPVILRLKVADRDEASTTTNCKLVLQWRPLDEGCGSVDPEDDQCGLPYPLLLGPHIGITVCSTCYYTITFGSPVDTYKTIRGYSFGVLTTAIIMN